MAEIIVSLRQLLQNPERFSWDRLLFLPQGGPWTLETQGSVVDEEEIDIDPGDPEAGLANGMKYALSISQVTDIIRNAREQRSSLPAEELLRAFQYYFDHDAFITF